MSESLEACAADDRGMHTVRHLVLLLVSLLALVLAGASTANLVG